MGRRGRGRSRLELPLAGTLTCNKLNKSKKKKKKNNNNNINNDFDNSNNKVETKICTDRAMPWYCTVAWKPACLHGKRIGSKMNSDKPTHMKIKIKIREKKHLKILMKKWTKIRLG